ncbi:MAG: DUF1559 domain-containing protein [Pirellulales bacterium]|nr:DUF1559 domain-containing protein [Pirellulales bacterium]
MTGSDKRAERIRTSDREPPRRPHKLAFTLVELLVVIAIIGILIALLLPAVQAAREAARRSQCSNNMKQLGLALHNYHDAHSTFPPAFVYHGRNPGTCTQGWEMSTGFAWRALILPQIEQAPIYDQIDFKEHIYRGGCAGPIPRKWDTAAQTVISAFICPSDDTRPRNESPWAGTNYAAVAGVDANHNNTAANRLTVLTYRSASGRVSNKISDIVDGTSNTLMSMEVFRGREFWGTNGGGADSNYTGQRCGQWIAVGKCEVDGSRSPNHPIRTTYSSISAAYDLNFDQDQVHWANNF